MKKIALFLSAGLAMLCLQVTAQTTEIKGLVALVKFNDSNPLYTTKANLEALHNQETGFNLFGNTTSVREFYKVQSNNKVTITANVVQVNLTQTSAYYLASTPGFDGPQQLVQDVIANLRATNPTVFNGLTPHPTEDRLWFFSMITAGDYGHASAFPIHQPQSVTNNGTEMWIRNVALLSNHYDVGTFCHEYGHLIMGWTDYYQTAFSNLGDYCVMASGGTDQAPMPLNPALRLQKGWITSTVNITGTSTQTYTLTSNSYTTIHKYANPRNSKEYLLFHAVKHGGYYQPVIGGRTMDQGLAIWYVDEEGGIDGGRADKQYMIRLVQADNKDEMHDENTPIPSDIKSDLDDLYDNVSSSFPNGHPLRWRDGGELGISISNITAPNTTLNFTVNARPATVVASSDAFGTLSPKGTLSAASGSSKTFTFTPNLGYVLNTIKVNGVQVTASSPYTLTNITGTKTIEVTFKRQTTAPVLPSPWQKADIGSASSAGYAAHSNGSFYLESYGSSTSWSSDNCAYVYQTLTGDGSLVAHIAQSNKPSEEYKVGIMLRANLQTNGVQSMLVKMPNRGLEPQQRSIAGNNLDVPQYNMGQIHLYNLYNWMKITRVGNVVMSYCSLDGLTWIPVGQQTISFPNQVLAGIFVTGANGTNPSTAVFDVARIETTPPACTFSGTKLTGTVIGTEGSWDNAHFRENVYDGNPFTYFDANDGVAWAGLTMSSPVKITTIKFFPRQGGIARMLNGKFQGSNSADFSTGWVDLATITNEPAYDWNCITVSNTNSYKYLRYISPTDGFGNVAEVEFYGAVAPVPPTVSITSPVNNATFTPPASITINATATDADGTISKVEFYNGSTLLNTDVTAPYSYTWPTVAAGTYSITAKATDNASLTTTSTTVTVVVSSNTPPTVSISSPANNATFAAPGSITINATAADANGTVSKVDFYNGSTLLYSDATSPFSYSWTGVAAGTYSLTAKATDNANATTTSSVVTITVTSGTTTDFCFEAESGLGQTNFAPFQVLNDASASGGKYIVVPNGTGDQSAPPSNSIATFSFNVPVTATYYYWLRVIATTSSDNSILIRTDANSYVPYTPGTYTAWTWKKWSSSSLTAGSHSISIARNEDGLQIDKIIVTKSSSTPSGLGCGASARMDEDGTEETAMDMNTLFVSPNPSSDVFSITATEKAISYLSVSDAVGVQVFSSANIAKGTRTDFGNAFENGMYTVLVKYEDGETQSLKVIKIR